MKTCSKCGVEKELSEFDRDKSRSSGFDHRCKVCASEKNRKWRAENPEKVREKNRKWRAENPEKVRELRRKYKAQQRELTAMGQVMDLQEYLEGA